MKKNYFKKFFLFCSALTFVLQSHAQAPANDNCSGAISFTEANDSLSCSPTSSTSTANATTATYTSACWTTSYDDDIWYSFVATSTQARLVFSNLSVATGTIGFTLFQNSCTATSEFFCSGTAAGIPISIPNLTIGDTYYISMFYFGTTDRGTFDFCLYNFVPPANDNCAGAISVPISTLASCTPVTATTTYATGATYTSACWNTSYDDDVWYSFVASNTSLFLNITNQVPAAGIVGYSIFENSCTNTEFFCNVFTADPNDTITGLTIGNTYYMSVFYGGTVDRGTFDICIVNDPNFSVSEMDEIAGSLKVFPNPATDNLSVNFQTGKVKDLVIKLADLHGKEIYTHSESSFTGEFNKTIDLRNLSKGIYFINIISDKSSVTRKIVVQ